MNSEEIIDLFNQQKFDKLRKETDDMNQNELCKELSKIQIETLVHILPKLSKETILNTFFDFSSKLQMLIVNNLSDVDFRKISEILLSDEEIETKLDKEIFSEIILNAKANDRHEKLVEIIDNVENKTFSSLKPILQEMEPYDIAEILNDIDDEKTLIVFRLLPKDLACDVFVEMDNSAQETLLKSFTDSEISSIVNDLYIDDTADLIEEMPSNVARKVLKFVDKDTREHVNKILGYPKDSAGSIMTSECITLRVNMTVEDALEKIRKQALDKETIYTLYVTDDKKKLLGICSAKDIILHNPKDIIGDFMQDNIITVHTSTDKEVVSQILSKYDLLAVPVLDSEDRILGIVTIDDAVDVMTDEVNEDISKMAAMTPTNKPYLQTSVFRIFLSRLPWLLVLLISATFTGLIIYTYETTLTSISPVLFACIPMLMDSGGNAGSQASVTIIRSLALDEVSTKDILKIIWKEIRVAVMLAGVLAIACFAKLQIIDNLIFGHKDYTIIRSLVVSISLFFTICVAKLVGACLPLLAKKLKLDPAVVASPFITTIVDALSLIIYCKLAILILL